MGELEHILNAAGDAGAVIVLAICTWLIIRVLKTGAVEIAKLWRDSAKERNAIDEKRNEIDDKMADVLVEVSKRLERLQQDTSETNNLVTGLRREHQTHDAGAIERHGNVMNALTPINAVVTGNASAIALSKEEVMNRLNVHGRQLDALLQKIELFKVPEDIRGDLTKVLEIVTTMHSDVKALRPSTDDLTEAVERALARNKTPEPDPPGPKGPALKGGKADETETEDTTDSSADGEAA